MSVFYDNKYSIFHGLSKNYFIGTATRKAGDDLELSCDERVPESMDWSIFPVQ